MSDYVRGQAVSLNGAPAVILSTNTGHEGQLHVATYAGLSSYIGTGHSGLAPLDNPGPVFAERVREIRAYYGLSAHDITATVSRSHGETFEHVALACSCGVPIPAYKRAHNGESPARDAAGFPIATGNQRREMQAHARQAHARAGVQW